MYRYRSEDSILSITPIKQCNRFITIKTRFMSAFMSPLSSDKQTICLSEDKGRHKASRGKEVAYFLMVLFRFQPKNRTFYNVTSRPSLLMQLQISHCVQKSQKQTSVCAAKKRKLLHFLLICPCFDVVMRNRTCCAHL